jgi:hypothetical protein
MLLPPIWPPQAAARGLQLWTSSLVDDDNSLEENAGLKWGVVAEARADGGEPAGRCRRGTAGLIYMETRTRLDRRGRQLDRCHKLMSRTMDAIVSNSGFLIDISLSPSCISLPVKTRRNLALGYAVCWSTPGDSSCTTSLCCQSTICFGQGS